MGANAQTRSVPSDPGGRRQDVDGDTSSPEEINQIVVLEDQL